MNRNLSAAVDLLTIEIERVPDRRLAKARELILDSAMGPARSKDTDPAPLAALRCLKMRLRRFWHAVAIRFRSRVGLPLAGSGS